MISIIVRQRSATPVSTLHHNRWSEPLPQSLVVAEHNVGNHTGWIRFVAHAPEHALKSELRFKHGQDTDATAHMGEVDGRNPEALFDELTTLIGVKTSEVISIETGNGQALIRARSTVLPTTRPKPSTSTAEHPHPGPHAVTAWSTPAPNCGRAPGTVVQIPTQQINAEAAKMSERLQRTPPIRPTWTK